VSCARRGRVPAAPHPGRGWCTGRAARDREDAALIRRAAGWLRTEPEAAAHGLVAEADRRALAALLDLLAAELPHVDAAVRRQAVESCRVALGGG
jgi:hypothetical protein